MRTPKAQDSDNVLTKTTEVRMKHYDKGDDYNERIVEQQNLIAKEASMVQACGYIPTDQISAKDWGEMVGRDRRIPGPDGYTYNPEDVYRGEEHNPRYL